MIYHKPNNVPFCICYKCHPSLLQQQQQQQQQVYLYSTVHSIKVLQCALQKVKNIMKKIPDTKHAQKR